jgi:hypothetical protein
MLKAEISRAISPLFAKSRPYTEYGPQKNLGVDHGRKPVPPPFTDP